MSSCSCGLKPLTDLAASATDSWVVRAAGFSRSNRARSIPMYVFTTEAMLSYSAGAKRLFSVVSAGSIMACCIFISMSGFMAFSMTSSPYTCCVSSITCFRLAMLSLMLRGARWWVPMTYEGRSRPLPDTFHNSCAWAPRAMQRSITSASVFFIAVFFGDK